MPVPPPRTALTSARRLRAFACAVVLALATAAATGTGSAATGSSVVGATVLSATSITMTSCLDGTANVTEFGSVTPLSNTVTSLDCTVGFGSTNDSSQLRLAQADGGRDAMYRPTTGTLDPTFDFDGRATVTIAGYAIRPYPGGGMVAVGEMNGGSGWEFGATRLNENGSQAWQVYRPMGASTDSMAFDVAVDAAGRLLLAGYSSAASADFALMRLEPDGDLDPTFNAGGTPGWNTWVGANDNVFYAVAVQPSGRILAAGFDEASGNAKVYGFTSAGVVDTTFGTSGIATLDYGGGEDGAFDLHVNPDGTVLVAGMAAVAGSWDLFVTKLGVNGAVDTGYGAGGVRMIDANHTGVDSVQNPVQMWRDDGNGTTYVAGTARPGTNEDLMVAKLDSSGTLVPGFGSGAGRAFVDLSGANTNDDGFGVVGTDRGGIFALGMVNGSGRPKIVRLDATTGALDPGFGTAGIWTSPATPTNDQYLGKLSTDTDGRVVSITSSETTRFTTVTIPDYLATTSDWSTATGSFAVCLRAIGGATQVDGSTWAVDGDGTPVDGGDCLATTGDTWQAVPDSTSMAASKVAMQTVPGAGTVSLRWGLRTATSQSAGHYVAPLVFEVLAPNGP